MTDDEYLEKSQGAHKRLAIIRDQIERHMASAHQNVSGSGLDGLIKRLGEIADELTALDGERWGDA